MTKSTLIAAAALMWTLLLARPVVGAGGGVVARRRHGAGARGGGGGVSIRHLQAHAPKPQEKEPMEQEEEEADRILRRNKGKAKTPQNCCELVKRVLELDKACKSVVASAEKAIVCEEEFTTVVSTGKGSSALTAEQRLAAAFLAFDSFITSFQNNEFVVTQDICFPATADPIALTTFGDWCVSATIVDGVISYAPEGPIADLGDYLLNY